MSQQWGSVSNYSSSFSDITDSSYAFPKKFGFHVASLEKISGPSGNSIAKSIGKKTKSVKSKNLFESYPYDESDDDIDDDVYIENQVKRDRVEKSGNSSNSNLEKQMMELNERTKRIENYCRSSRNDLKRFCDDTGEILNIMKNQHAILQKMQVEQMKQEMGEMGKSQKLFSENKRLMTDLMETVGRIIQSSGSRRFSESNLDSSKGSIDDLSRMEEELSQLEEDSIGGDLRMMSDIDEDECFSFV